MATLIRLDTLRETCRKRAELRAPSITDAELTAMINSAIASIHRKLCKHDKDRLLTSELITIVNGTASYDLDTTFLHMMGCDVLLQTGSPQRWANVSKWDWGKRNAYEASATRRYLAYRVEVSSIVLAPEPQWDETNGLRVWFVPVATQLSADDDTWNSIGYWEEYVINKVAVMACAKTQEDPSVWMAILGEMEEDLVASMTIDVSEPGRVRDRATEYQTEEPVHMP